MIRLEIKCKLITTRQVFFIERVIELLHRKTLDSYRARVLSPYSILKEIINVISEFELKSIKHFDPTVKNVLEEGYFLLKNENELSFDHFTKDQYLKLLHKPVKNDLEKIALLTRLLYQNNSSYIEIIYRNIDGIIKKEADGYVFDDLKNIDILTGYLITEIINKGFSKRYLYRSIIHLFVYQEYDDFSKRFIEFFSFLDKKDTDKYFVIFKCSLPKTVIKSIFSFDKNLEIIENIEDLTITEIKKGKKNITSFLNYSSSIRYFRITVSAHDYFIALKSGRYKISEFLDIINLGFTDRNVTVYQKVLILPIDNANNWEYLDKDYELEGSYKIGDDLFKSFSENIIKINENVNIIEETKDKIVSAIRYLRLGNESSEIEHKFINYWLGLEYLYSDIVEPSTINLIKRNFCVNHSLYYIMRSLIDFHNNLKRLNIAKDIPNFDDTLEYLKKKETFEFIRETYNKSLPLISYRANHFENILFEKTELKKNIKLHENNLEWHFTRIYRIRNKIIHDAAINMNIIVLAANLKYYLSFSLDLLISSLQNDLVKSNKEVFDLNLVVYENFIENDISIDKLMSIEDFRLLTE